LAIPTPAAASCPLLPSWTLQSLPPPSGDHRLDRPSATGVLHRALTLELDSCRFIEDGWAAKASNLSWATLDLWGCHPERPVQRVDLAGALWLLGGGDITAISDRVIAIRTPTGSLLAFCRRLHRPAAPIVAAWELTP
jgi:hypothetical protein